MTNAETPQQTAVSTIDQAFQQAIAFHQAGQLPEAERLYRTVLQIQPNHSDAHHNLGLLAEQIKQVTADLPNYKAALETNPSQGKHWQSYAEALLLSGQAAEALMVIKTAIQCGLDTSVIKNLQQRAELATQNGHTSNTSELSVTNAIPNEMPANNLPKTKTPSAKKNKSGKKQKIASRTASTGKQLPQAEVDQLASLFNAGRYAELEIKARLLVGQYPNAGFAWKILGACLQLQNKDALQALQKATMLLPNDAQAHSNLGVFLEKSGEFKASEASCRRALKIDPGSAAAHCNLGNALLGNKQLDKAIKSYRQALKIKPDYADARNNLANALTGLGQLDNAVTNCRQVLETNPDFANGHNNLGIAQKNLGQLDDAIRSYRRALEIKPNYAEAHNNLGNALRELGQLDEAVTSIQHALEIKPDYAEAHNNLGNALQSLGELNAAETSIRRALEINPDEAMAYNNLLFLLNYHPDLSAEEIYQAYQEYDSQRCIPLRSVCSTHNNDSNPDRRLRIGYVSPDFRRHSCRLFLEPLLAHHDKTKVEVYAYAELAREDEVTTRFKNYVEHWIPTKGMSDEALAQRIRNDSIDILVELAGHTAGNRLLTFARKPAPVSLSWLGYGYTTGVSAIDYYLTDETCAPVNSDGLFAEQPLRIDTPAYVYRPSPDMGEVSSLPALQRGHITFGTLTRSVRVNHRTIRVWSELLKAVPNARLVINSSDFKYPAMQERMASRFTEHGIARERLEIGFHTPPWDVLRGIDIGLDCFPHNSGTTLFETLHMGVPYITLAGRPSVGRLGSSILQGLGNPEWIAENEEEYVGKAVKLANDTNRLSEIRAGLRDQMENSPLIDEKGFALKVETAYRNIWQNWCQKNDKKDDKL